MTMGRMSSAQPSGVTHSSQRVPGPESAIIRTTKATPSTAHAQPGGQPTGLGQLGADGADGGEHHGATMALSPSMTPSPAARADAVLEAAQRHEARRAREDHADAGGEGGEGRAVVVRAAFVRPASTSCQRPASSSPRSSRVAARAAHTAPMVLIVA